MSDPAAVTCQGLRFAFGDLVAVDGLDLSVAPGEIFGLLGPNGAGKTTAIRVITSLLPVPAGTVEVFGQDVTRQPMAVRRSIGYVPQLCGVNVAMIGAAAALLPWLAR